MYQAKCLKTKHLEVKARLKVQKHSLKAQGSEHQWLESQEKKQMSLMKSSNSNACGAYVSSDNTWKQSI